MKQLSEDQLTLLKKPLEDKAITEHPTKPYLSSIKAVYVTERMNDVFGVGAWTTRVEAISHNAQNGMVVVKVIYEVPEYGIYYESYGGNDNGGSNNKNFDLGDAYKGATTDAITKIGSFMGIAIDVFKGAKPGSPPKQNDKPKIDTWLTEDQFNKAMLSDKKGIEATLKAFDGNNGKGMKKEYREQLQSKIK